MPLSIEDLKNLGTTVIETTDGPTNLGTGQQHNVSSDTSTSTGTGTVVNGDNHGGIRQNFR